MILIDFIVAKLSYLLTLEAFGAYIWVYVGKVRKEDGTL